MAENLPHSSMPPQNVLYVQFLHDFLNPRSSKHVMILDVSEQMQQIEYKE